MGEGKEAEFVAGGVGDNHHFWAFRERKEKSEKGTDT